jgi:hypothetical protein
VSLETVSAHPKGLSSFAWHVRASEKSFPNEELPNFPDDKAHQTISTRRGEEVNETFDIFSGAPEEDGLWVEAIEGFSNARQRMGQIAAEKPGKYFLFSNSSQSFPERMETFTKLA